MAEPVGLALGVVALIGTFKDCIDCFAYISTYKDMAQDYMLLLTELDVEKALLLQWSNRVGLFESKPDRRLDDPIVKHPVQHVLEGIRDLLNRSTNMGNRYGLSEVDKGKSIDDTRLVSKLPTSRFVDEFEQFRIRTGKRVVNDVSALRRVRWAIYDKEKFKNLTAELSNLILKLNQLIPDDKGYPLNATVSDQLQSLSLARPNMAIDLGTGGSPLIENLAKRAIEESCESRVLSSLWYRAMNDRFCSLDRAHHKTLHWALEPPKEDAVKWDNLSDWLRTGSGIYWISGKAGSGKSTLMKYLYELGKTKELLHRWAGTHALITANFFFYALGISEQHSQHGLSRALLYQILQAEPSLIPKLFPGMWREAHKFQGTTIEPPSPGEVKNAYEIIGSGLDTSRRFCFFIDGLDEYSGNPLDGISFIKNLVKTPNIKVVLSSRPIPTCVQFFSDKPRLKLQDLTEKDIEAYINDVVGSHSYMRFTLDQSQAREISKDLAEKASGVFLWVVLACKSLTEGFACYDNVDELRNRVDELPRELEDLFRQMLERAEPRYRAEGVRLLRVCYQNRSTDEHPLQMLGLAMVDINSASPIERAAPVDMGESEKRMICGTLKGRIRSRCCGLLEVKSKRSAADNSSGCFCDSWNLYGKHDKMIDSTLEFMHRTVYDFLKQPGVWDLQCLQVDDVHFDPSTLLSCAYLQLFGLSTATWPAKAETPGFWLKKMINHAGRAEYSSPKAIGAALCRLEDYLCPLFRPDDVEGCFLRPEWPQDRYRRILHFEHPSALQLAVEIGLVNVLQSCEPIAEGVTAAVSTTPGEPGSSPYPLLIHAVWCPYISIFEASLSTNSSKMTQYLLSLGCDPNERIHATHDMHLTPWELWLEVVEEFSPEEAVETTQAFILAGANLTASKVSHTFLFQELASLRGFFV